MDFDFRGHPIHADRRIFVEDALDGPAAINGDPMQGRPGKVESGTGQLEQACGTPFVSQHDSGAAPLSVFGKGAGFVLPSGRRRSGAQQVLRGLFRTPFLSVIGNRLESATSLRDLAALPGNRFEALMGDRKGQYSIRINDQWRICFEWPGRSPGPSNVEIVDYH